MAGPECDHDILMELKSDVKHIVKLLEGNGQEGLITIVDRHDTLLTKHGVYFALLSASLFIGVPVATWLIDKMFI